METENKKAIILKLPESMADVLQLEPDVRKSASYSSKVPADEGSSLENDRITSQADKVEGVCESALGGKRDPVREPTVERQRLVHLEFFNLVRVRNLRINKRRSLILGILLYLVDVDNDLW